MAILPYFEILMTFTENIPIIVAMMAISLFAVKEKVRVWVILSPFLFVGFVITVLIYDGRQLAAAEGKDMSLPSMRTRLETYIVDGDATSAKEIIEADLHHSTFGMVELERLIKTLLPMVFTHNIESDNEADVPGAYNKGDDWFEATLGDPMVYTSGLYTDEADDIWMGQQNKLNFIADGLALKAGDKILDIGCGWGRLLQFYADRGAHATGVTLSTDQQAYGQRLNKKHGNQVDIKLQNFFTADLKEKSFDVISSVEMAEHVGIRNYNAFLERVKYLLVDDGSFYLQVAGLRRGYGDYNPFEELTWGLFMDEHVFPGADASCPMGWVLTHLEKAGFEVQRVVNMGSQYSRTLQHWLDVWENKEKKAGIVKTYGVRAWRRWEVFLAWSVRIARRGGSSVFMFVATKAGNEAARVLAQQRIVDQLRISDHKPTYNVGTVVQ